MCYINKLTNRQETMKCLRDKHIYNHTYITYIQTNIHYITCIATLRQLKSKWPVKPVGVDTVKYVAITVNYWTPNDILCVGKLHKICLLDCGIFGFFTSFFFLIKSLVKTLWHIQTRGTIIFLTNLSRKKTTNNNNLNFRSKLYVLWF